jgi:hypothetical protein
MIFSSKVIAIHLQYALHEFWQIAGSIQARQKMKMSRHQTIMDYPDLELS